MNRQLRVSITKLLFDISYMDIVVFFLKKKKFGIGNLKQHDCYESRLPRCAVYLDAPLPFPLLGIEW